MVTPAQVRHRVRRLAARSLRVGRRVLTELRTPSDVEQLMNALPVVAAAPDALAGQTVLITGATQGVGLVVARRFATLGARVILNGRRPDAVRDAVARLAAEGLDVTPATADVTDAAAVAALLDAVPGGVDLLINNAAVAGPTGRFWDAGDAALADTVRDNLTGPILATAAFVRRRIAAGRPGRVINVSTIATEGRYPGMVPYSTTKAALEAFTRHAASDLPQAEVIVTGLILPSVRTERKAAADWASAELLPPAESLLPAFEHVATAPASELHGRILSAARFLAEPAAEAQLAGVASLRQRIAYPPLVIRGAEVARDPARLTLLDRAENQFGPSPKVAQAVVESLTAHGPNFYPDERSTALRAALAAEHGLGPEAFAVGPGSWEIIDRAVRLFAGPGEEIVSSGPGWFGFNVTCRRHGVAQTLVPFDRGETGNRANHNLAAMRRAIGPRTRMVYLISPSNPEGVTLQDAEVREFLDGLPGDLPVIIDEAYAEYADDPGMVDVARLVREGRHAVIGLRTFSKFYGLAGMRVGYAFARPALADLIARSEQIFQLTHAAEMAAVAALGDRGHRARVHADALAAREALGRGLDARGLRHIPSHAPYIFADAPPDFEGLVTRLAQDGMVIAPYRFSDGRNVMLPVGTPGQVARLLAAVDAAA